LSPLVHEMQQPSAVYSHLQWQLAKVHWQHWMPLLVQQQLQQPSASMRQRFCSVAHDNSSSQRQWILKPPVHFSNSTLQRGTTHQLPWVGPVLGKAEEGHAWPGPAELGEPNAKRSITTALDMKNSFLPDRRRRLATGQKAQRTEQSGCGVWPRNAVVFWVKQ
jgi:hypothetical protein